jgi:D-alanyl-D-alanine carboxypeptidase
MRAFGRLGAGLVGVLVGALLALGVEGMPRPLEPKPGQGTAGRSRPGFARLLHEDRSTVLMAWSPGELPKKAEAALQGLRGVDDVTTVMAGLEWIHGSYADGGAVVDDPPHGLAIPFEIALVEPREYAHFVAPEERAAVRGLDRSEIVLAETEARLRGAGPAEGLRLDLASRSARVSGVVSDVATNGYEALLRGPAPPTWSHSNRYVLMRVHGPGTRARVERHIQNMLEPGEVLRVRARGETPYLRYGDAVLPQMLVKQFFGEFAGRPLDDGRVLIDPDWERANIRTESVPLLGEVSCHRAVFGQLEGALTDIVGDSLNHTIRREDYGGCYSPRFISRDPGSRLSHHAWGIAIDMNVQSNAFGTRADQDPQLVKRMEQWGFTWGGEWLVPDGMHFEWVRWP